MQPLLYLFLENLLIIVFINTIFHQLVVVISEKEFHELVKPYLFY